ncbi:MAG: DUF448 domain-containing protein [Pyramidobacter porci]|uniref:RNase P modulator RnpM n=1 Tax=Pyramidobacter porci TaxID=2605789 RepID=UPI002A748DBC|nr:DUF448 domain-containing protein [Pyramidobacter porci]MDY2649091.1 DUF448 domain-containing protein [Pyramidobacter porci]
MRRSVNPRSCVACRRERAPRDMLRVVRRPDGQVVLDEQGKTSGRGAYVCPEPQCVALCLKRRLLEKSLKCSVPAEVQAKLRAAVNLGESDALPDAAELFEEIKGTLGLARRAGELIVGQDRVLNSLSAGQNLFVLLTRDHSETLKRAIDAKAADVHVLAGVSRLELGQLLGLRQAQIVALPLRSGFAEKIKGLLPEGGNAIE